MAAFLCLPLAIVIEPTIGLPEVSVPVLSSKTWFTFDNFSRILPPLTTAPMREARLRAAACGIAAARRRPQGQATTQSNRIIFQLLVGNIKYQIATAPTRTIGTQIALNFSI